MRRRFAITAALLAIVVLPPAAIASDPSPRGYGGIGGEIQSQVERQGDEGRALPFTGVDVAFLGGGGILLLLLGGGLWRLTRAKG